MGNNSLDHGSFDPVFLFHVMILDMIRSFLQPTLLMTVILSMFMCPQNIVVPKRTHSY